MFYTVNIEIIPHYWNTPPNVIVFCNKKLIDSINSFKKTGQPFLLTYKIQLDQQNIIQICMQNKTNDQTVVKNGKIIKDQFIQINDIEIDGVSLTKSMLAKGIFKPIYPPNLTKNKKLPKQINTTQLNFNGAYSLEFSMPIHEWFFQHLD